MADAVKNFCKVNVSGYYGTTETTIYLQSGEGAKLPTPPFNAVFWNATDYQDPSDDPYREIIRITAINGDVLTVQRGQEDTTVQPHNISGKTYKIMRALTAKDYEDLQTIAILKDGSSIASRSAINFVGGDVSDDSLNKRVNVFLTGNFAPRQTSTPSLKLYVSRGVVVLSGIYVFFSGGESPSFSIPTSNPRIDLLVLNSNGQLEIIQGTEASSPSPPSYPGDKFVICEVFNRPNQTSIKDTDDGTNGYIYKDARGFVSVVMKVKNAVVSDNVRWCNDDARWVPYSQTMVKIKEIKLNEDLEAVRVYFEAHVPFGYGGTIYVQIYKNGSPIGTLRTLTQDVNPSSFNEDFTNFKAGDLIQIYGRYTNNYSGPYVRNMRLKFDREVERIDGYSLLSGAMFVGFRIDPVNQDP